MDFPTPNQSRDIEVHTLFLTLNTMKVATIYLLNGILVRNLCNLHSSEKKALVSTLPKQKGSDRIFTTKLPKEILGFVWSESSQNTTNHTISPKKGEPKQTK